MHIFTENTDAEKIIKALSEHHIVSMRGFSSAVEENLKKIMVQLNQDYPARFAMKMVEHSRTKLGFIWDVEKYQVGKAESLVKENYQLQHLKHIQL